MDNVVKKADLLGCLQYIYPVWLSVFFLIFDFKMSSGLLFHYQQKGLGVPLYVGSVYSLYSELHPDPLVPRFQCNVVMTLKADVGRLEPKHSGISDSLGWFIPRSRASRSVYTCTSALPTGSPNLPPAMICHSLLDWRLLC